jgi:hypothetical protein
MSVQTELIATSSTEEGLDFACSLASGAMDHAGSAEPGNAAELLHELASYIQFRYVGEFALALEYLASLGRRCDSSTFQAIQFWRQLRWVAAHMGLEGEDLQRIELPSE